VTAHAFLVNLAMVLGVAAITTVLFQRLHQPVVLGYLIAGLLVGPHVPVPVTVDASIVQVLSELGVILLMFSLGLELSVRSLMSVGAGTAFIAVLECSLMMWIGFAMGQLFGWDSTASAFVAGLVTISSTTIIARTFDEQGVSGPLRELVFGVLVVEDLIAILLVAALTAAGTGSGLSASGLAITAGRLLGLLALLLAAGLLVVPRVMRAVVRLQRAETTLVASIGLCFAMAVLATELGYSVALGAFLAGSLVAESGHAADVERLVHPVRDMFAAIFFVSVGMLLDPEMVAAHWLEVLVISAVVMIGKVLFVSFGVFLAGNGVKTAVQSGMSMAQIGEFSFIIAGVGVGLGAVGAHLYPVAVAVSAITALTTPAMVRLAPRVAAFVDRALPRPLQTFASLYGAWLDQLRAASRNPARARVRRSVGMLALDATLLTAVVIAASLSLDPGSRWIVKRTGVDAQVAVAAVIAAACLLALPFLVGVVRLSRKLGLRLADRALPAGAEGAVDLTAAPRRALIVALQLACILLVAAPMIAVTQPFLPPLSGVLLLLVVGVLGIAFWRGATNLQGHVRAGAELIVEVLAGQAGGPARGPVAHGGAAPIEDALRGLGAPEVCIVGAGSAAAGRTLAEINLRGATGATVLAIRHGEASVVVPSGHETLRVGDVLALAGSHESLVAARALLEDSAVNQAT
jgi:K+:H+ antiporter